MQIATIIRARRARVDEAAGVGEALGPALLDKMIERVAVEKDKAVEKDESEPGRGGPAPSFGAL